MEHNFENRIRGTREAYVFEQGMKIGWRLAFIAGFVAGAAAVGILIYFS